MDIATPTLLAMLQAGDQPVTYVDPDGRILMINQVGARNLKQPVAALIGRSVYELMPEMARVLAERFREIVDGRQTKHYVDEVMLPDGPRWFESVLSPVLDERRACIGVASVSRDVTDSRNAKRLLEETERTYELALDALQDALWDWDIPGCEYRVSPSFSAMLGYSTEDIPEVGLDWFMSVLHPDDRERVRGKIEAHFRGETEVYEAEYRWRHKNGTWRWARARGKVVEWVPDGGPQRMVGVVSDVTERHALQARLLAAEKMEAIGRLAGGVAHDFNNLLTTMMGHVEFLSTRPLDDRAQQDLGSVAKAVKQASRLTHQLLSFARRGMVQPRAVAVNPLWETMRSWLDGLLGAKIRAEFTLAPTLPDVYIDPSQLEQVFMNLTLNARDAMPHGGQLGVTTSMIRLDGEAARHRDLSDGDYVQINVSDTGVGMSAEVRNHIFEPFFTTKGPRDGTGLGLASIYGIVKQAGGDIDVVSEEGAGSMFRVFLPAVEGGGSARSARVLVVEDEAHVRQLLVRSLTNAGYAVTGAETAERAIEIAGAADAAFDLLVTDLMMPGLDGAALATVLKSARPDLSVIFISGFAHQEIPVAGVNRPGHFLQKPFRPSELLKVVADTIGGPSRSM